MGKGEIVSEYADGKYLMKVLYDRESYDAQMAALTARVAALDAEIPALEAQLLADPTNADLLHQVRLAKLRRMSAAKRIEYLEDNAPTEGPVQQAWCADYTEGLTGEVATIEAPGYETADSVNIAPGYADDAAWSRGTHGILGHAATQTPAAAFYNLAMKPGWLKWMPLYRRGTLQSIDRTAHTATVYIEAATAVRPGERIHGESVNLPDVYLESVPFDYMNCDDAAFEVGDDVLVKFRGQPDGDGWTDPVVIGFQHDPRQCSTLWCMAYVESSTLRFRVNSLTKSTNVETALLAKWVFDGFEPSAFTGIADVIAVSFADKYPFRIGVLVEMEPGGNGEYLAGKYALAMFAADVSGPDPSFSLSTEEVYFYSLNKVLDEYGHVRVTDCLGRAMSSEEERADGADLDYVNECSATLQGDCTQYRFENGYVWDSFACYLTKSYDCVCCTFLLAPCPGPFSRTCCPGDPCCADPEWPDPMTCDQACANVSNWTSYDITCAQAVSCGAETECNAPQRCISGPYNCGSAESTHTAQGVAVLDNCRVSAGAGPIPFGMLFGKTGVPTVYMYGSRDSAEFADNADHAGTQCGGGIEGCGDCVIPLGEPLASDFSLLMPDGKANSGVDFWSGPADELAGEYELSMAAGVLNDGAIMRFTRSQMGLLICSDPRAEVNKVLLTDPLLVAAGAGYYAIKRKYEYTPPAWASVVTDSFSAVTFEDFDFPPVPPGGTDYWTLANEIRDSAGLAQTMIVNYGTSLYRTYCSLGDNLSLTPGLAAPMDNPDRTLCFVSSRDDEGNPGIAYCRSAGKVLCFMGWTLDGGGTLTPSGSPSITWTVSLPSDDLRGRCAMWAGSVEGVAAPD